MFIRMQLLVGFDTVIKKKFSSCVVFFVMFLTASSAYPEDAELTNLIVRNNTDELQIDLMIKGIFTEEMRTFVSKGIPISLTFLILLYEVRDYWFDNKVISKTARHEVKFDVLRQEYRIRRSWEKTIPLAIKEFEKAKKHFFEIKGFDVIPQRRLKKGKHYQLKVKSELTENKFRFTGFRWEFETDWYTINFIY